MEKEEEEVKEKGAKQFSVKIWKMALPSFDLDAEVVECRRCSREAGANRGIGSARNHYRVGCLREEQNRTERCALPNGSA